jgi:hypothetical protein
MSDLKQTLNELVRYLDTVNRKALPTARPDASTTKHIIQYTRTGHEISENRQSADARVVVACKYVTSIATASGSNRVEGTLKQAVIAARHAKRRGGNNAKWAQEIFGNMKRMGGIALQEVAPEAIVQPKATQPKVVSKPKQVVTAPIVDSEWSVPTAEEDTSDSWGEACAAQDGEEVCDDWESAW